MRLDHRPETPERKKEDLDLFEYPATLSYRVAPPQHTLLTRVALAGIPVLVVTVVLILFADLPIALFLKGTQRSLGSLANFLLFLASGSFIFPSLVLTILVNKYVFNNRIFVRRASFVFLCVLVSGVLGFVLLRLAGRYSPGALFLENLQGFSFLQASIREVSFPAIPVMLVTSLLLSIHLLYPRFGKAYVIVVLAVAISCIVACRHFLSDTVCGLYMAFLATLLTKKGYECWWGRV